MSTSTLRISLGLLTTLAGFEVIYAALEASVLLAGLLGIVNLGLALAGAYLLTASSDSGVADDETITQTSTRSEDLL